MGEKTYIAIDLKSFYASVECVERGLDPLTTNLVVADASRTTKTVCLAVTPSLKRYGISGRARLFQVVERVKEVNALRRSLAPGHTFTGTSSSATKLDARSDLELDYIVAPPRMAHYVAHSAEIYGIYLKYIAPEDIHVYSIDEVFLDVTHYLDTYKMSAHDLAMTMILDVLRTTGITATAGIAENLYLCKVAMDITAKHIPPDSNGVRIAQLDEQTYRRTMWTHRPLTDFWRVGKGVSQRLEKYGITTMGDIARCSVQNEDLLYRLFGVNAELIIDHAWGWEPCTIADIKAYRPESNSFGSGQVLQDPYLYDKAEIVLREMAEQLALDLVAHGLVKNQVVLHLGYDRENLSDPARRSQYQGAITSDTYGRPVPKPAHGTENLERYTSSSRLIVEAVLRLCRRVVDPSLLVRRLNITAGHVIPEADIPPEEQWEQLDLFTPAQEREAEDAQLKRERRLQETMLGIKAKFGKNAILKGTDLKDGATAMEMNRQIGGHKA